MNAELIEKTKDEYEKFLNELYGSIQIGIYTFGAGRIIRELDPLAFRRGMAKLDEEWLCNECNSIYDNEDEAESCCKEYS